MDIQAQQALIHDLETRLREARIDLENALIQASGVSVGDKVRRVRTNKLYRVAVIEPHTWGPTWVTANPQRKDGSFGTALRNLYDDWEKV